MATVSVKGLIFVIEIYVYWSLKYVVGGNRDLMEVCTLQVAGYKVVDVESGVARCPYDPTHNSTALYVGQCESTCFGRIFYVVIFTERIICLLIWNVCFAWLCFTLLCFYIALRYIS